MLNSHASSKNRNVSCRSWGEYSVQVFFSDPSADNDRMVADLERQLEEARHELAQKRKEDKELRGHELKQNIQISGVRPRPSSYTYSTA